MAPPPLSSVRSGVGAPLLLLHGVGATHADFHKVFGALASSFDVIAIDLPGHGASPGLHVPPTVEALTDAVESHLEEQGVGTTHVLGNSLGGRVAIELARRRRATSVLAIAPFGPVSPPERLVQGIALVGAGVFMQVLRPVVPTLSHRWWGRCVLLGGLRARPWSAKPVEAEALGRTMGSRDYWRTLVATAADAPVDMDAIECPVTLVQGTADWLSGTQTIRYARKIPGAEMSWLLFAGHAAHGDSPAAIVALMHETAGRAKSPVASRVAPRPTPRGTPCLSTGSHRTDT